MVRLRFALLVLAAALLAGCGSSPHGAPSQGLVVQTKKAVLLVSLDGRVLRTLPGYSLGGAQRDIVLDDVIQNEYEVPVLLGPQGRVWEVAGGVLVPIRRLIVPLPGGVEIAGRIVSRDGDGAPNVSVSIRDVKTGKPLTDAPMSSWFVTQEGLLVTPKVVIDLRTRMRWLLRDADWAVGVETSSCDPAGVRGGRLVAACRLGGSVRMFSVAHDGSREAIGMPFRYPLFGAQSAFLSPDGKHVAASLAVGCGSTPSIVAPTDGGTARWIDGSSDAHPGAHVQSWVLGWSAGGEVVAEFSSGECIEGSPPAIYLVDPRTFARTRIYVLPANGGGYAMWSSSA